MAQIQRRHQTPLRPIILVSLLLTTFGFGVNASAQDLKTRATDLEPYVDLSLPSQAGPHPLAVLMPGCLSWHPHHTWWKNSLLERGYAVLHVDSFAAANITSRHQMQREVCTGQRLSGAERAGDLIAVLVKLQERNDLDFERLYTWGWSHGAFSLFEMLMRLEGQILPPNLDELPPAKRFAVNAAFLYYPYCGPGSLDGTQGYPAQTRTIVFHGDRDVITNPMACRQRVDQLAGQGAQIEFMSLPEARHWFDNHAERATFDASATGRVRLYIEQVLGDSLAQPIDG